MAAEDNLHLPGLDGGESAHKAHGIQIKVANQPGQARSTIHLEATWPVPPEVVYAIFTYPDNSSLFRDIKKVGQRKVITSEPHYKVVEVEQVGEVKALWITRSFSTWLRVTEDARDPKCLITQFDLIRSDVLAQFSGRWELRPHVDPTTGEVTTISTLTQDVLPRGVPPILRHVPVMGDLLRGVTMRSIRRVVEDLSGCVDKIQAGMAAGKSCLQVLKELCGACEEQGHANGAVASHHFDISDDEEEPGHTSPDKGHTIDQKSGVPNGSAHASEGLYDNLPGQNGHASANGAAGGGKGGDDDEAALVPLSEFKAAAAGAENGAAQNGGMNGNHHHAHTEEADVKKQLEGLTLNAGSGCCAAQGAPCAMNSAC